MSPLLHLPRAIVRRRRRTRTAQGGIAYMVDEFPRLSETFIRTELHAMEVLGHRVRVEAAKRTPRGSDRAPAGGIDVTYLADDSERARRRALVRLAVRRPVACARDLVDRRRWRREEAVRPLRDLAPLVLRVVARGDRHLHAHFAKAAALDALRVARLSGRPYSVTAHAYDIFETPANLREKLTRASFSTGVSEYAVDHLRAVVGEPEEARVHRVAMGVDAESFRRQTPPPAGRTVAAVGRLIEKKGFTHLLDAAALLHESFELDRLVIVGGGQLRDELRRKAELLGLSDMVDWRGRRPHAQVRKLLEQTDVLAVPSVVASDGNRDGIPVVIYEALAMEVPVIASDAVGLSEVVRPEWGRLVPPGQPEALAEAIRELLSLPAAQRAEMGRAGRAFVVERRDPRAEAAKLARLIDAGDGARRRDPTPP